jgi:hypothetical protein
VRVNRIAAVIEANFLWFTDEKVFTISCIAMVQVTILFLVLTVKEFLKLVSTCQNYGDLRIVLLFIGPQRI